MGFIDLIISAISVGFVYAMLALGVVIIFKATKVLNFAHGEWTAFGTYLVIDLKVNYGVPLLVAIPIVVAVGALMGVFIQRLMIAPLFGTRNFVFFAIIATISLGLFLRGMLMFIFGGEVMSLPEILPFKSIGVGGLQIPSNNALVIATATLVILTLALVFKYTRLGIALRAVAQDQHGAASLGINLQRSFAIAWAIGGSVVFLGGVCLSFIIPAGPYLPVTALKAFTVILLGGLESLPGAVVAGVLMGLVENIGGYYLDVTFNLGIKEYLLYFIAIFILIVRPYGLFGSKETIRV